MTVTLNIPPPPEGYGPECLLQDIPAKTLVAIYNVNEKIWRICEHQTGEFVGIYALPVKPWYPPSWYGEDGKLLPDVYEHTPGDWPKHAKPGDEIDYITRLDRVSKNIRGLFAEAEALEWSDNGGGSVIVAYRVISRVQP